MRANVTVFHACASKISHKIVVGRRRVIVQFFFSLWTALTSSLNCSLKKNSPAAGATIVAVTRAREENFMVGWCVTLLVRVCRKRRSLVVDLCVVGRLWRIEDSCWKG